MTKTTITINRIYVKEGTTKAGKPYRLTKLLGTDSNYYTTFKPISESIKEGMELTIETIPTGKPGTFSIAKIIEYTDTAHPKSRIGGREDIVVVAVQGRSDDASNHIAKDYARTLLADAVDLADKQMPGWKEVNEYPYLIAVLVQVMHGKLSGDRIAQQEAEKLKAYGGKFR